MYVRACWDPMTPDDAETLAGTAPGLPISTALPAQSTPSPLTHLDAVGDHIADSTVLKDAEVVHAVGERGPVVVDVSKVDGHRGDRGVPADRVSGHDLRTGAEAAAWGWKRPVAGSPWRRRAPLT